ncbi:class I SAM-dependent methyltransferase [Streptomyces sp. DSM 42041]|uniref:Class I SAM-dependent methyltransferase n=1 Tax=Streptomyces hazeniae TaxID=3075538 RepID=A0ABU2NRA5_9ACTN|nr:class I SAM-dependent methyltransferase [Streptomyces sp. DSM 42041]MDT0379513.1 class I SAM-dependent methyltransferase [Streptomyces sp. DSM 42041]
MERTRISALAHTHHPIAAPLADAVVAGLLERALPPGEGRVLDLGCGGATWLRRGLDLRPGLHAVGVDLDAQTVERARRDAAADGLGDRLALHAADAREFAADRSFDSVLCVGATHAFGGLLPTLAAARRHLAPGGTVLVGDGFWEREPDRRTLDVGFAADEYADLATTVDRVTAAGWTPVYGHTSTAEEWDDYEWSWTGSLAAWALDNDADAALEAATRHRDEWLHGYRGTLGFVTLVLRRTWPDDEPSGHR